MTAIGNPTAALRACIDAMTPSSSQEETAACILAEKALRGQPFPAASLETAACLWEAVCEMEQNGDTRSADPDLEARGGMIRAAREAMGSSALRLTVIGWTAAVDAAWLERGDKYDFPFDWEFVPGWIARNIDWSNPYAPAVRATPLPEREQPLEPVEAAAQMVDLVERLVRADVVPDAEAFAAAMRDAGDLLARLGIKVEPETPATDLSEATGLIVSGLELLDGVEFVTAGAECDDAGSFVTADGTTYLFTVERFTPHAAAQEA